MTTGAHSDDLVTYSVSDRVGVITLNRPPANALSSAMYRQLAAIADLVSGDESVHVCILTAAPGRIFCGGADVKELGALDGRGREEFFRVSTETRDRFAAIPVPTIAAITGHCAGAGVAYPARCDYRIASAEAEFCMPEIDRGSVAGGGVDLMALGVPRGAMRMMLFSAERYSAVQALAMHVVDEVVEPDAVLSRARIWAERVAGKSRRALVEMKRAIVLMSQQPMWTQEAQRETQRMTVSLMEKTDSREGFAAFVEKRAPRY